MSQHLQKISSQYHALVHCLGRSSLSYKDLEKFINNNEHMAQPCTKITTVKIYPDVSASPSLHFQDFEGPGQLSHELQSIKQSDGICRLFIVENICPETVVLLGEHFSIDPQFFVDHIKSEPWYRIVNVAKRIPPLPSSQKLHDFLHLRWIETRTLSEFQPAFRTTHIEDVAEEMILRTGGGDELEVESDARSFMWPDKMTTRIPRKAGKLNPRTRTAGEVFQSLLCTRQAATVWFNKTEIGVEGWTGIILVDPPFKLPYGNLYCQPAEYRSFNLLTSILKDPDDTVVPASNREALARHLKERFTCNSTLLSAARADSFLFIGDLYRLIASNWIVINEYVNREMATIEYKLEKEEPSFRDLEVYLKDLYIYRRRCTKYHELISEARDQCYSRGQASWSRSSSSIAIEHAKDMEADYSYLLSRTEGTAQRTEKNINLLTSLVAIGAGKQGLDESHSVSRLNLLAIIFLPFSTIATILGMQGNYAPGAGQFWLFWAVAVPLTAGIFVMSALHGWNAKLRAGRLMRIARFNL